MDSSGHGEMSLLPEVVDKSKNSCWFVFVSPLIFFLFYFHFRYDNGRVLACQGRVPERFYYVLSGRGKLKELVYC